MFKKGQRIRVKYQNSLFFNQIGTFQCVCAAEDFCLILLDGYTCNRSIQIRYIEPLDLKAPQNHPLTSIFK